MSNEQLIGEAMRYAISQLPGAEEIMKIKYENEKLKKQIEELKADDVYQQEIIQKYNEENTMLHEKIKRLEEENEKLKEGKTLLRAIGTMMIDAHIAEHPEDAMAKEGFASEAEYQAWKKKAMGIPVWYWIS